MAAPRLTARVVRLEDRCNPVLPVTGPLTPANQQLAEQTAALAWWGQSAVPEPQPGQISTIGTDRVLPLQLQTAPLWTRLQPAPTEADYRDGTSPGVAIALPRPDGVFERFEVFSIDLMEPGLAAEFPDFRFYLGRGLDDPAATVAASWTANGFRATARSPGGDWSVSPYYHADQSSHVSYFTRDARHVDGGGCGCELCQAAVTGGTVGIAGGFGGGSGGGSGGGPLFSNGTELKTFRLAVAATGEFAQAWGGNSVGVPTVEQTMAVISETVHQVSAIYRRDLAIQFVIPDNNSQLVFLDPAADPYIDEELNGTGGSLMLAANQVVFNTLRNPILNPFNTLNYDVGHVFNAGFGGGVALLKAVGNPVIDASGRSGKTIDDSDNTWIVRVAHELGHMFGANHTWNKVDDDDTNQSQRSPTSAYEIGAGSTVMSYNNSQTLGVTSVPVPWNATNNSQDRYLHFHNHSIDEILTHLDSILFPTWTAVASGNNPPVVNAGVDFTMPTGVHFQLQAAASDPEGKPLLHAWEQMDLGPSVNLTDGDTGVGPLFRNFELSDSPTRIVPRPGYTGIGENLPTTNRTIQFRAVARDNNPVSGAVATDDLKITVVKTATAFAVTSNFGGQSWQTGDAKTVTWNTAGTNTAAFNALNVRVGLSLNGGATWPIDLGCFPNTGSAKILAPGGIANGIYPNARLKVANAGNNWFALAPGTFTLNTDPVFTVTNANNSGTGSLRQAVLDANATPGATSITFDPAFFSTPRTITLTSEMTISGPVTILGPGKDLLTVNGNGVTRIFNTQLSAPNTAVTIEGVTLVNGKAAGAGGAILAGDESVTLRNVTLQSNSANGSGGAVAFVETGGALRVESSTLMMNSAGDDGGAISLSNGTQLGVTDSNIRLNTAADDGGGIYFNGNATASIISTGILQNTSQDQGGGIYLTGQPSSVLFFRLGSVTLGGNQAADGGGIRAFNSNGSLQIYSSTIRGNTATVNGGGINRFGGTGIIQVRSSVIAGNTANGTSPDVENNGTLFAYFHSAIGSSVGLTNPNDQGNNLPFGTNLKLGTLADNGGPSRSYLPAADSPLVNAGVDTSGIGEFDQRGVTRNLGGWDIGAVERAGSLVVTNTLNTDAAGSLRRAVADSNTAVEVATVTFDPAVFSAARAITPGELEITRPVTILGPGRQLTLGGNKTNRLFTVALPAGTDITTVENLTLTDGSATGGGGAILATKGQLVLRNLNLIGNQATGTGGAVSAAGNLVIENSSLSANASSSDGGAIAATTLTVRRTEIAANTAGTWGGGVFLNGGSLTVENSTVAQNQASFGGGIYVLSSPSSSANLFIRQSTVSGNQAANTGGGVRLSGVTAPLTVTNSTLTQNQANLGGGLAANSSGTVTLTSSVLAGNTAASSPDVTNAGPFNYSHSVIGSSQGLSNAVNQGNNLPFGTAAKLAPLAYNGGPTRTHLPLADSPLVNAGMAGTFADDQRGPGHPRNRAGGVDIGATEARTPIVVTNANNDGPGSLRQAVLDANTFAGFDTITFDPTFFATPRTITLANEIVVADILTVQGPGADRVAVSGNNATRLLNITDSLSGPTMHVELVGLTFTRGWAVGDGGAIRSSENLIAREVTFAVNAANGSGGAVHVSGGGFFSGYSARFLNNTSGSTGGGLSVVGNAGVSLFDSTLSGNTATGGGGAFVYGGLSVARTTFSGNAAVSSGTGGGGLAVQTIDSGKAVVITNSTFSGNTANGTGGGIRFITTGPGTVTVFNSTVTKNTAAAAKGGGGIARDVGSVGITLESTVVSGNTHTSGGNADLFTAGEVRASFSAVGTKTGVTTWTDLGNNLAFGTDVKLGLLADNGGPTATHLPSAGSPLINAGSNPGNLTVDQRGNPRVFGKAADIGSVEVQTAAAPPRVSTLVVNGGSVQRSRVTELAVTFDQVVTLPSDPAAAFVLTLNGKGPVVPVTLSATPAVVNGQTRVTLSGFTGEFAEFGSLKDGAYTLTVVSADVNGPGGPLDGNGDGQGGDNYGSAAGAIVRLFGDSDGNRAVNFADFLAFRAAFGTAGASEFDFNNDNQVNFTDFLAFRSRFGTSI